MKVMADRASKRPSKVDPNAPPAAGVVIGDRYVVQQAIAEGGMGWVLAARHRDLDEIVAIKVLKHEFAKQPEIVARFAREAKASMQIRSDHCVRIMDVGSDWEIGPFIVMEYLEGDDLASMIADGGRLTPRRAADLMLQVCDALAHAHVLGIIHRDIKSENIFIIRHGGMDVVRVLDFGISKMSMTGKVFETDVSLVKTQSMLGSPVYMSPEQMRNEKVDVRSDVWSVGATLYEAVAAEVPFNAPSIPEICSLVLEQEPRPLPLHVPKEVASVIMKCLRKDPKERYQNVGELALALVPAAPKASLLWAERIVSLLNAHGAGLDASALESEPVLPTPSIPPSSRQPQSGPRSLPTPRIVRPDNMERAVDAYEERRSVPEPPRSSGRALVVVRRPRRARKRQALAAALGTFFALAILGFIGVAALRHAKGKSAAAAAPTETATAEPLATAAEPPPAPPSSATVAEETASNSPAPEATAPNASAAIELPPETAPTSRPRPRGTHAQLPAAPPESPSPPTGGAATAAPAATAPPTATTATPTWGAAPSNSNAAPVKATDDPYRPKVLD
jgi:eukaryotic-like serine/threonine-protein kinase